MKFIIFILFLVPSSFLFGQREIIYDLDSYKQVIFKRSEFTVSPSGRLEGSDRVNVQGNAANTLFRFGSNILHEKFINDSDQQYYMRQSADVNISKGALLEANRSVEKRAYNKNRYLKTGYIANTQYNNLVNPNTGGERNEGFGKIRLDLGLGFGRIENVNSAWIAV